eukprot:EC837748.1.p1 GENE.EC837748.1~~EC837748.1.p1  ORF type:complete len:162 (-),score=41.43 EC837748.1:44-529(-)
MSRICSSRGAFFYGIMMDPTEVWSRMQKAHLSEDGQQHIFQEPLRTFTFTTETYSEIFGTRWILHAPQDSHDEFMTHAPTIISVARRHDLACTGMPNMLAFYEEHRLHYKSLLQKMGLIDKTTGQPYEPSAPFIQAAGIYAVFVFQKLPAHASADALPLGP